MIGKYIDKFFDFLEDPTGSKKRKADQELKEWIEKANENSRLINDAIARQDWKETDRLISRFKYL